MRHTITLTALVLTMAALPARADDGQIPHSTLTAVGLSDLAPMTDAQGAEIRGAKHIAVAMGVAVTSGFIVDPSTKNFLIGIDANNAIATGKHAHTFNVSAFQLNLYTPNFSGFLYGGAGGNAWANVD